MKLSRSSLHLALFALPLAALAESWPFYHGPSGNRATPEAVTVTSAMKKVWDVEVNTGFSSFCVADGKAFTLMTRDIEGNPTESVVAFDAASGKELWASGLTYIKYAGGGNSGAKDNNGGNGPMSTPTYADGKVFVYDAKLNLHCLDAASGKPVWKKEISKLFGGRTIKWDNASSPLLAGSTVVVYGGGKGESLLAFQQKDGALAWKGGDELMTHATPILTEISGVAQIIFFCQSGLVSVDPKSGEELWRQAFDFKVSTAASPVVDGNVVYCSAGYGVGGGAYELSLAGGKWSSKELWRKEGEIVNHWSTPVLHDGHLYGMFSFKKYGDGPLACVDIRTGEMKWQEGGFGPGHVILAGGKVLALSDSGELVSVDPSPAKYNEIGRAKVVDGKCWTTPVVAGGKVYVRSTTEGKCFEAK